MTIRATKFTPEVLLSASRRSPGVPNYDASQILYKVQTYSFEDHKWKREIRLLHASTNESVLVTDTDGASEPNWIGEKTILVLVPGEKGVTDITIGQVDDFEATKYVACTVDAAASTLKLRSIGSDSFAVAFVASAKPDGSLFNEAKAPKPHTTGRLYKSLFVRHWDTWSTPNRNAVWYGTLEKPPGGDKYQLSEISNILKWSSLESPITPFGGADNFDISVKGIAFVTKDHKSNAATHTKQNLWLALRTGDSGFVVGQPKQVDIKSFQGATSNPTFSPDGRQLAFTSMRKDGYESDKNELIVIQDVENLDVQIVHGSLKPEAIWDRSPQSIAWSPDGMYLYLTAEDRGRVRLFSTRSWGHTAWGPPRKLAIDGSVSDVQVLPDGRVFFSSSSLVDNSAYYLIGGSITNDAPKLISSNTKSGSAIGLSRNQVSQIWFDGAQTKNLHAWVVKPSDFDPKKKYPLAYLIHGGPQGAWDDSWSTRWNPAVFAEQGYVVVTPNPTGSTGYGQALTDAIQDQWGGLPYQDLVKGFEYIEENLEYVDTERAVALGASYGGYMANWIQGQPLGRKFKALVTHDGVFSLTNQLSTDELYFPEHEFEGKFWDKDSDWETWSPSKYTGNWATPHLIIHSELDYRLAMSEGLAAFNVLQERGVESQFLTFPDENHWILKPENSLLWHAVVLNWINEHVGLPRYGTEGSAAELLREANMER